MRTPSDLPRRSRRSSGVGVGCGLIVAVMALFLAVSFVGCLIYRSTADDVTFTVEDKERVCDSSSDGDSECRYLIFTDNGTYQVTDSWAFLRFNSSDVYGRLKEGRTYDAEVVGWRLPLLSRYKNIIEADEVAR